MTLAVMAVVPGGWMVAYRYGCYATILFFLFWGTIAASFIDLKMHERRCLRACYLQPGTFLAKLLLSPVIVTLFYLVISLTMALSGFLALVDLTWTLRAYLAVHTLTALLLYRMLLSALRTRVKEGFLALLAREWSIDFMAVVLVSAVFYAAYEGSVPAYLHEDLRRTVVAATNSVGSACGVTDTLLRLHRELEAMAWWFMTKESAIVGNDLLRAGSWILFLLYNSLAVLGLNRFTLQVVHWIESGMERKKNGSKGEM
ncbi:hypothetical protein [Hydrogenimonas sp.]